MFPLTSRVLEVLAKDTWARIQLSRDAGPGLLRLRTPIVAAGAAGEHTELLQILWAYGDEDSGALPPPDVLDAMIAFENRLCAAWEHDGCAFLAAVFTFDGARQWVFYTRDVAECGQRLEEMVQEDEPYPIELTTRHDPSWSFLHEELLAPIADSLEPAQRAALHGT